MQLFVPRAGALRPSDSGRLHRRGQPTAAAWLRGEVEALLPERLEDILDYMAGLRGRVKETVAPADRAACLSALFAACLAAGGPPAEGEALLSQWEVKE